MISTIEKLDIESQQNDSIKKNKEMIIKIFAIILFLLWTILILIYYGLFFKLISLRVFMVIYTSVTIFQILSSELFIDFTSQIKNISIFGIIVLLIYIVSIISIITTSIIFHKGTIIGFCLCIIQNGMCLFYLASFNKN